ncbi:FAD-dependent oxidoreductase [Streptomyces sp. NPDC048416]|uniref:FAD-dependent oxidoreductase n=1 Tax=Streptomyces sp. NPDC048416 TaxID=3365546 RepID=UPI00372363DA
MRLSEVYNAKRSVPGGVGELLRAGCHPVVYEADRSADGPGGRRLGGRMYSRRLDDADSAVVELGCMRFPDSARLLRQYAERFGLHWEPFRENYAADVTPLTVLDVDGRQYRTHRITDLHALHDGFRTAHTRWEEALSRIGLRQIQRDIAARNLGAVRRRWQEVVDRYELWSFYRFLRDPEGVGLTHEEARILGTAGVGPAAWDCFFDLGLLEILRLVLCSDPARSSAPVRASADSQRDSGPTARPMPRAAAPAWKT